MDTPIVHQSSTTFHPYMSFVVDVPRDGEYLLDLSYGWSYNNATTNFLAHVEYDGDFFFIQHVEPKDVAGVGTVEQESTGGTINTGTDQIIMSSGKRPFSLTQGQHTFTLEFRGQTANNEATVYEAYMELTELK